MKNVAIVVDSTTEINKSDCEKYDLHVIPLSIVYSEDEEYLDGVDISSRKFFERLLTKGENASTSQPSLGRLEDKFVELSKEYKEIIFITLSSGLSGTYQSANAFSQILMEEKGINLRVFDSLYTAGVGVDMAIQASRLSEQGKTSDEIIEALKTLREQTKLFLIIDDLTHMFRMGRIGKASHILGSALKIKPVLQVVDGEVTVYKKMRTMKKTLQKMIELLEQEYRESFSISIINGYADELCKYAKDEILKFADQSQVRELDASPVIGAHTGANSMCICWMDTEIRD